MHTHNLSHPKMITLIINQDQTIQECHGKQLQSYGYTQEILYNKHMSEVFPNKTYIKLKELLNLSDETITVEWLEHNYEVSYQTINNSGVFNFFDISSYMHVETKLQQSLNDLQSKKEELQAVFDLAANGISILDHDGMFLYANKFFQKMMGYTMEELYTESCISLSSPEYAQASETAVQKAIKYGSIENFRKICITKSGVPLNASMSLSYLKNRDEILMITSDITQDIQYQDELKKQVELEVAKRTQQYEIMCHQSRLAAMGEMIDSIAHQWRQPLNSLGIIVQGLRHLSRQESFNHGLLEEIETEIMEKISYMSQTIDDFSTFFRISKQKESFDVLESINDAIRLIEVQLKLNHIEIQIIVDKQSTLEVIGFPNEFRQVILNMIHNAMNAIMKTKPENRYIHIDLKPEKNTLLITIADNGGGIDEAHFEKIFDPYFTTRENGSGIGLYMSKVIIEHHMQGRLQVKNINDGAAFTIILQTKELSQYGNDS